MHKGQAGDITQGSTSPQLLAYVARGGGEALKDPLLFLRRGQDAEMYLGRLEVGRSFDAGNAYNGAEPWVTQVYLDDAGSSPDEGVR